MKRYNVTQQYAKDAEKPIAEFYEYDDASFFVERKLLADQEKNFLLIYRLFENQKVIKEFNKEKITCPINKAQYATGDRDLPYAIGPFKLSKDHLSTHAFAGFSNLNDAELFVEDKLTHHSHVDTMYYIFNRETLVIQMNQRIKKQNLSEESNQTTGQASSFQPTPFNTSPKPPGSPSNWIKDNKEENEK